MDQAGGGFQTLHLSVIIQIQGAGVSELWHLLAPSTLDRVQAISLLFSKFLESIPLYSGHYFKPSPFFLCPRVDESTHNPKYPLLTAVAGVGVQVMNTDEFL